MHLGVPIGSDGDLTQRNDLHGSPLEVVIGSKAWLCDRLDQAQALFAEHAGRNAPEPIVYPVR